MASVKLTIEIQKNSSEIMSDCPSHPPVPIANIHLDSTSKIVFIEFKCGATYTYNVIKVD